MRFYPIVSLLLALFLTSCANEGVIVRKDSGPLPFYESLGMDGSYKFVLRDSAGSLHRQLVTPDIFERYAVGDIFNDLQRGSGTSRQSSDFKETKTASAPVAQKVRHTASANLSERMRRTASVKKPAHSRHIAVKAHKSRKTIAKHTPKKKAVRAAQAQPAPATASPQILLVAVARCR